jgi:hypothetical protein
MRQRTPAMEGVAGDVRKNVEVVFMTVGPTVVSRRQAEFPSALQSAGPVRRSRTVAVMVMMRDCIP